MLPAGSSSGLDHSSSGIDIAITSLGLPLVKVGGGALQGAGGAASVLGQSVRGGTASVAGDFGDKEKFSFNFVDVLKWLVDRNALGGVSAFAFKHYLP